MSGTKFGESGLGIEEAAMSCFRAYGSALAGQDGVGGQGSWEGLSLDIQGQWLRLVRQVEAVMSALEGRSFHLVQEEVFKTWAKGTALERPIGPLDYLSIRDRFAWEAVARHLNYLLDADELDVAAVEASWKEWADKKMQGIETTKAFNR